MSLSDLRARAHALQAKADQKIAQIKAGTYAPEGTRGTTMDHINNGKYGVDITGTKYDPRKSTIDRMTTRQVEKHIERLENFNSNVVGYYRGAGDSIISKHAMARVIYQYDRDNKLKAAERREIGGTFIPWVGVPVDEYDEHFRPRKQYLESGTNYSYNKKSLPVPTRYYSDKGALRIADAIAEQNTTRGRQKNIRAARNQIDEMIQRIGTSQYAQLKKKIDNLDDKKFWFLWSNDSKFADELSMMYDGVAMQGQEGIAQGYLDGLVDSQETVADNLSEMVDMADSLDFQTSPELAKERRRAKRKKQREAKKRKQRRAARQGRGL